MDISKLSVTDLKALAYDRLATIERAQADLNIINQEIAKKQSEVEQTPKSKGKNLPS